MLLSLLSLLLKKFRNTKTCIRNLCPTKLSHVSLVTLAEVRCRTDTMAVAYIRTSRKDTIAFYGFRRQFTTIRPLIWFVTLAVAGIQTFTMAAAHSFV